MRSLAGKLDISENFEEIRISSDGLCLQCGGSKMNTCLCFGSTLLNVSTSACLPKESVL